ncbi:MAG TPA: hypothetical protein VF801_15730 [Rhodocyclaceae bacterium]
MNDLYWLILGILAAWRLTHLLHAEDGPWEVFVRFRRRCEGSFLATLLDCFNCLSLWTSAPIAWIVAGGWMQGILLWLAISGGAILLEGTSAGPPEAAQVYYREDPDPTSGD